MATIETRRGISIIVDEADLPRLSQLSWWINTAAQGKHYAYARLPGANRHVAMHRFLMNPPADAVVHHINNDGLDNRRDNLVVVTQRDNVNFHFRSYSIGVHIMEGGRFRALVRLNGRRFSLGVYDTEASARLAVALAREAADIVPRDELPSHLERIKYRAKMSVLT